MLCSPLILSHTHTGVCFLEVHPEVSGDWSSNLGWWVCRHIGGSVRGVPSAGVKRAAYQTGMAQVSSGSLPKGLLGWNWCH